MDESPITEKYQNMKIHRKPTFKAAVLFLAIVSLPAMAVDEIIVNGTTYQCESRCVYRDTDGGFTLRDEYGGWVRKLSSCAPKVTSSTPKRELGTSSKLPGDAAPMACIE